MLTHTQELFLVLAVVYCLECLRWSPRGAIWLRTFCGRRRAVFPAVGAGNPQSGLVVGNPIPPLAAPVPVGNWPLSLSTKGIATGAPLTVDPSDSSLRPLQFIAFESRPKIATDAAVLKVAGNEIPVVSPAYARWLADLLRRLCQADGEGEREAILQRALDETVDREAAGSRWTEFLHADRLLALPCNALFLFFFACAPIVSWRWSLVQTWKPLLIGLAGLWALTLLQFFRAHRRLYPEQRGERIGRLTTMTLLPLGAVRARDVVAQGLFAAPAPLTVAHHLSDGPAFARLAGSTLLDLRHGRPRVDTSAGEDARATLTEFRQRLLKQTESFVEQCGLDADELTAPPRPHSEEAVAHCPRCRAQFRTEFTFCDGCNDTPVRAFHSDHAEVNTGTATACETGNGTR